MLLDVVVVAGGYLLGCFPTAALVGRRVGHDPALEGSRNPGATNVYRVAGTRAGVAVLAGDLAKGAVAAAAGLAVGGRVEAVVVGAAAVVGHVLPAPRRFRGGKGVATAAGTVLVADPAVAAAVGGGWLLVVAISRRASLGSVVAAAGAPLAAGLAGRPAGEVGALAAVGVLVIARHRQNISRLLRGEEPKLAYRRPP